MQVDPIKPTLKAPGTKRLKLKYVKLLSILLKFCLNFASNFNLRRYTKASTARGTAVLIATFTLRVKSTFTDAQLSPLSGNIEVGRCRLTQSNPS